MAIIVNVKSITPANGWAAVYEFNGNSTALPLVCWAHGFWVEESDESLSEEPIFGMVVSNGNVVPAATLENFSTYDYDHESTATDYMELDD